MKARKLKVGITEMHGIAQECAQMPLPYVEYNKIEKTSILFSGVFQSTAFGVLDFYKGENVDLIEAPLFPILTNKDWLYTPADTESAMAFNLFGLPTPRFIRSIILRYLFSKKNFKGLLFKSNAGLRTLSNYPLLNCQKVLEKTSVLYPAVRKIDDTKIAVHNSDNIQLIFVGEFFRKGGKEVVDAFLELEKSHKNINLVICADREKHFEMFLYKDKYLEIIDNNEKIKLCFVSREELFINYLPKSQIFLCPTFQESFGYAILEAMAFGLPVISTNYFAIPEMVQHGTTGYTIDITNNKFIQTIKGYNFTRIPEDFSTYVKVQLIQFCSKLISDNSLRQNFSENALASARNKFSFEIRNKELDKLYKKVLDKK